MGDEDTVFANVAGDVNLLAGTQSDTTGGNFFINAGRATSGATDKAGGHLFIDGGKSTGTGAGGSIYFRTANAAGSTGTSDNNPAMALGISGSGSSGLLDINCGLISASQESVILNFGSSNIVSLTHSAQGLLLGSDKQLQFRDNAIHISSDADGYLNVQADTGINLNINGTDELAITASTAIFGTNIVIPNGGFIGSSSTPIALSISAAGVVSAGALTASSSTSTGALVVGGGLGVAADINVGDDLSLLSDAAILNFGADRDVSLTHVADTGLLLNAAMKLQFRDDAIHISSDADGYLNVQADTGINLNINGTDELAITASTATFGTNIVIPDAGTIGSASDTNALSISAAGVVAVTATTASSTSTNGALTVAGGLGVAADLNVGDDLSLLSDGAILNFGADSEVSLTHVADTGLTFTSTTAATSGVKELLNITHETSGTPANGIGTDITFNVETTAGNHKGMTIGTIATDVSSGAEDFDFVVKLMESGGSSDLPLERMRLTHEGSLQVSTAAGTGAELRLYEGSNYVALKAKSDLSSDVTFKLPTSDGSSGHVLKTDGSGNLSFGAASGGSSTLNGITDVLGDDHDDTNFARSLLIETDGTTPTTGSLSGASDNIGIGNGTFSALVNGTSNVGIGNFVLDALISGANNTCLGYGVGSALTSGSTNTAIGSGALATETTASGSTAVGRNALASQIVASNNSGNANNVAVGKNAGTAITTGVDNTVIGTGAGSSMTTGTANTFLGKNTGDAVTTGGYNTLIGIDAGGALTTGSSNTIVGSYNAQSATVGGQTVCVGYSSLTSQDYSRTNSGTSGSGGNNSTTIELDSSSSPNGTNDYYNNYNIVITDGGGSGTDVYGRITDYVGSSKIATFTVLNGVSVTDTTSVSYTIGGGYNASGFSRNTVLGYYNATGITQGYDNTIIGAECGNNLTTGQNSTIIGYGATASSASASNEFTLGNSSVTSLRCADTTIASLSDSRDKTNVVDSPYGLDFIDSLRPVQFTWQRRVLESGDENHPKNGKNRVGFLAQDLQAAMPSNENDVLDLVYDVNPERIEAKYGNLIPILTQAIKDLKAQNDALTARVEALENA